MIEVLRTIACCIALFVLSSDCLLFGQRDSLYGLDSTILFRFEFERSLFWPNGELRSQTMLQDSILIEEGFREDGTKWFEANYQAVHDPDGERRGWCLVNYKEFFKGTKIVRVVGHRSSLDNPLDRSNPIEEWQLFYQSGSIRSINEFNNYNTLCGKHEEYFENGNIALSGQYCVRLLPIDQPCIEDLPVGEFQQVVLVMFRCHVIFGDALMYVVN